jgi:CheY-like chemotaxis protein
MAREQPLVVVADDDLHYLDLMRELLSDAGYQAICKQINVRAYETIRGEKPDLVILDIPVENVLGGWNLLELLRLDPKTANIPVILCSANAQLIQSGRGRLLSLRCDVIQKPFDVDHMLEKVRAAIGPPPAARSVP